jgi:hypothetical protein
MLDGRQQTIVGSLVRYEWEKGGEMYFTTRKQQFPAENFRTMLDEPRSRVVAVLCTGGPGVFRREPVPDGNDCDVEVIGHVF